jgi:hypothetical protein
MLTLSISVDGPMRASGDADGCTLDRAQPWSQCELTAQRYCSASIWFVRTTSPQRTISRYRKELAAPIVCSCSGKTEKSVCSKFLMTFGSVSASRNAAFSFLIRS